MGRLKSEENRIDPKTRKALPKGVMVRGDSYRARKLVDGKQVSQTFDTAEDARLWIEQVNILVRKNEFEPKNELKALTFGELLTDFMKFKNMEDDKKHTGYIFRSQLASKSLFDITSKDIIKFRDDMLNAVKLNPEGKPILQNGKSLKRYSKSTVVRKLNVISSVFSYAIQEKRLPFDRNPALSALVKRPENADLKRNRRISQEELKAILKALPLNERYLVLFALYQGARQGEILGLLWRDVDLTKKTMKLHHTKNMKFRTEQGPEVRPLMPMAWRILKVMKTKAGKLKPSDGIFDIDQDNFAVKFGRVVNRLGIDDLHFHDLRHEATSRLAEIFPSAMELKRITGHRDLKSLDRYYHPDLAQMADIAEERMRAMRR